MLEINFQISQEKDHEVYLNTTQQNLQLVHYRQIFLLQQSAQEKALQM